MYQFKKEKKNKMLEKGTYVDYTLWSLFGNTRK